MVEERPTYQKKNVSEGDQDTMAKYYKWAISGTGNETNKPSLSYLNSSSKFIYIYIYIR